MKRNEIRAFLMPICLCLGIDEFSPRMLVVVGSTCRRIRVAVFAFGVQRGPVV